MNIPVFAHEGMIQSILTFIDDPDRKARYYAYKEWLAHMSLEEWHAKQRKLDEFLQTQKGLRRHVPKKRANKPKDRAYGPTKGSGDLIAATLVWKNAQ